MTDNQRDAIQDAMKPYAGYAVTIICVGTDQDVRPYGSQLAAALRGAHLIVEVENDYATDTPPGLYLRYGDSAFPAANALAAAMNSARLIQGRLPAEKIEQPNMFTLYISANK